MPFALQHLSTVNESTSRAMTVIYRWLIDRAWEGVVVVQGPLEISEGTGIDVRSVLRALHGLIGWGCVETLRGKAHRRAVFRMCRQPEDIELVRAAKSEMTGVAKELGIEAVTRFVSVPRRDFRSPVLVPVSVARVRCLEKPAE